MNKEEILEKSRKEKSDEGLIAAENQGRKIGIGVFCGVFVFIILFNFFYGQPNYGVVETVIGSGYRFVGLGE